jgi:hypothetical protein
MERERYRYIERDGEKWREMERDGLIKEEG